MAAFSHEDDPYADIVPLYDCEHDEFHEDIEFYLRLSEMVGDPILELGCGTGRILVPLAEAGWRVFGLDRSRPMLDRAMDRVNKVNVGDLVSLHEGEMTEADSVSGGPFGLVLFSLNGFMHLSTPHEQRRALEAAHRALDPRGMLVLDVINATPDYLQELDGRVTADGQWSSGNGETIQRFSAQTVAFTDQTISTTLWYDVTDEKREVRRQFTRFPLRYVSRSELELMLELAGFVEWRIYGSYDLDPITDSSDRMIVTAEVTASSR